MIIFRLSFSILILIAGSNALAWSDLGHSIVGGVAEQTINPQTKDFIRGLMGIEPLAVSAIFPDHVRDDDRFGHKNLDVTKRLGDNHDFADYHFCEIPTGFTYDTKPNKDVKDCFGAMTGAIALLKDPGSQTSKEEKQIALRYLVHVMGDISQPLHVGNGFDMGGNSCQILVQETPDQVAFRTNLHAFWDDTIVTYLGQTYADPSSKTPAAKYLSQYLAAFAKKRPEMFNSDAKARYGQGTLKDWLHEAQAIRESGLYPDVPGSMAKVAKGQEYKNRPYCTWFSDQTAAVLGAGSVVDSARIPVLDLAYEKQFAPVAETQLLKAGLRLAATLDDIALHASAPAPVLNEAQQEKILTDIQNRFRH